MLQLLANSYPTAQIVYSSFDMSCIYVSLLRYVTTMTTHVIYVRPRVYIEHLKIDRFCVIFSYMLIISQILRIKL